MLVAALASPPPPLPSFTYTSAPALTRRRSACPPPPPPYEPSHLHGIGGGRCTHADQVAQHLLCSRLHGRPRCQPACRVGWGWEEGQQIRHIVASPQAPPACRCPLPRCTAAPPPAPLPVALTLRRPHKQAPPAHHRQQQVPPNVGESAQPRCTALDADLWRGSCGGAGRRPLAAAVHLHSICGAARPPKGTRVGGGGQAEA